jgi:hypothetical protein
MRARTTPFPPESAERFRKSAERFWKSAERFWKSAEHFPAGRRILIYVNK